MEVSGLLSGGAPVLKKYQVSETFARANVPALLMATTEAGLNPATTTSLTDAVGITLDTATYTTTQGTGASSAERLVTVVINPDAIVRARFSGGATDGTALSAQTTTSASAGGTAVTTGAEWSSPTYVDGTVWGLSGANVGQSRKITTVSSTAGTVLVPFDYAIAVGDTFLRIPTHPLASIVAQLTTNLTEVDASAAISGDASFIMISGEYNGTTDSYGHFIFGDHLLNRLS